MEIRDYYLERSIKRRLQEEHNIASPDFNQGCKNFYKDPNHPRLVYWKTDKPFKHSLVAKELQKQQVVLRAIKSTQAMPGIKNRVEITEDGESLEVFVERDEQNAEAEIWIKGESREEVLSEYKDMLG